MTTTLLPPESASSNFERLDLVEYLRSEIEACLADPARHLGDPEAFDLEARLFELREELREVERALEDSREAFVHTPSATAAAAISGIGHQNEEAA